MGLLYQYVKKLGNEEIGKNIRNSQSALFGELDFCRANNPYNFRKH